MQPRRQGAALVAYLLAREAEAAGSARTQVTPQQEAAEAALRATGARAERMAAQLAERTAAQLAERMAAAQLAERMAAGWAARKLSIVRVRGRRSYLGRRVARVPALATWQVVCSNMRSAPVRT